MSNQEVDSFGRIIPPRNIKPPPIERSRRNEFDTRRFSDDRPVNMRHGNFDGPRRDEWPPRGPPNDRDGWIARGPDVQEDWVPRGHHERGRAPSPFVGRSGGGGGGGYMQPPPHSRNGSLNRGGRPGGYRDDIPRGPPEPLQLRPTPVIVKRITLPPMATFKNFMLSQPDDVAPEVFQRRYEDFQVQYVMDFSSNFFDNTKGEEWFRERYDPMKQHEMDLETIKWSQTESAVFQKELREYPVLAVEALRLEPTLASADRTTRRREAEGEETVEQETVEQEPVEVEIEAVEESTGAENEDDGAESQRRRAHSSASDAAPSDTDKKPPRTSELGEDSKGQLPSAQKRILYLSSIPAECSRSVLAAAVAEASQKKMERVCLSPPTWSKNPARGFERNAWVVVPDKTVAHDLMATLRQLRVAVPGPPDPVTGEPTVATTFEMTAYLHAPRHTQTVPEIASHPQRIASDTVRALELADLLDEDRKVPVGKRLKDTLDATLAENAALLAAIQRQADTLDVALGYLRRVHFVMFYGGRKYRDEAQMLSFSPMPTRRSAPTVTEESVVAVPSATEKVSTEAGTDGEEGGEGGSGRKRGREEDAGAEEKEEGEEEEAKVQTSRADPALPEWRVNTWLYGMDKRVDTMIADLRARANDEAEHKLSLEEEELKALQAEQEKILEVWEKELMKSEPENKMRCAVEWCNKLFKGPDFLKKHVRAKHLDMVTGRLLRVSEPFMRRRYEAEELLTRPLPLVPIEAPGGSVGVETRSVKEILERCNRLPRPVPPPVIGMSAPYSRDNRGRGRGRGRGGGGDYGDRRWSGSGQGSDFGHMGPPQYFHGDRFEGDRRQSAPPLPRGPPPPSRPLVSYVDVDAPEVTSTTLNYGMSLPPPPKKRKFALPISTPVVE